MQIIQQSRRENSQGTIGILVRSRSHLSCIIDTLRGAGLTPQAVEIQSLGDRPVVKDLLALTRALLHRADRISWLAILRAPWCGLTLRDLQELVERRPHDLIWNLLQKVDTLSREGQERAIRLRSILAKSLAEQGRCTLRTWVERTWIALGGPACLPDENCLLDAADYFKLLEKEQIGCDLRDFDGFSEKANALYAQPAAESLAWLQVMTIHKAKGLQFDTVILPGLGRGSARDEARLVLSHERPAADGNVQRLLAPISASGAEKDPIYSYLAEIEKQKTAYERVRLLYVAATRAQRRLYLLGHARLLNSGEVKPTAESLLQELWKGLSQDERALFTQAALPAVNTSTNPTEPGTQMIRRLPSDWQLPPLPPIVRAPAARRQPAKLPRPSFEWAGSTLRHVGTVVHALLRNFKPETGTFVDPEVVRNALAQLGVPAAELVNAMTRVQDAMAKMLDSERGRWILSDHHEARCEYSITGVLDGMIVRGTVDRTFVDESGTRWVIDYKTSLHQGAGLEEFLNSEQKRYREQLDRYARLFKPLKQSIRLGLYFPLIDGWREWAPLED